METITLIRDIALIVLAVLFIVLIVAVLIVTIALYRKVAPLLDQARATMNTVQGTSVFLAETAIRPVIRAVAFAAGISRGLNFLLGRRKR
jgi:DMSO reductase anchor subunit